MSYDPTLKTQVARWGKKSKTNKMEPPIMQEKEFGRNPFTDSKNEKKLRVFNNKLKQTKNRSRGHSK